MKKNFFKKLSFVMALAMIISVIAPAAGAFAATGAYLNSTKKFLYLNEEGKPGDFDFNIKNKPAGSASYTWTSDNTDVATVESPSGVVTAQAKGTAKITVVIKDKAGKKLKTLYARVYVRDNIETIKISNFTDKTVVKVAEPFDFNRTFVTFAGSTTSTSSITRYAVDNDKATINATTGVFTATEAGDYNVTAYAFASTYEYTKWLADKAEGWVLTKDTVKVTVAPSVVSTTQVDKDTFKVTFDSDMSKSDIATKAVLYQVVGDTQVTTGAEKIKEVKIDGKVVTFDMYAAFNGGSNYKLVYGDLFGTFKAASTSIDDVKTVVFDDFNVVITDDYDMLDSVKGLNADGVVIASGADLAAKLTFTYGGDFTKGFTSNNVAYIYTEGYAATVTVAFSNFVYDATQEKYVEVKSSDTAVATGVKTDASLINSSIQYAVLPHGAAVTTDTKWASTFSVPALDGAFDIHYRYLTKNITDGTYVVDFAGDYDLTFTSNDGDKLLVNGTSLVPLTQGNVTVLVKNADGVVVGTFGVTIMPARSFVGAAADTARVSLGNSAVAGVAETKNVKITATDSMNEVITSASITAGDISVTNAPSGVALAATGLGLAPTENADGTWNIAVTAAAVGTPGAYTVKVSVDALSATKDVYFTVIVLDSTGAPTRWVPELTTASYDFVDDFAAATDAVNVYGYNAAGARVAKLTNAQFAISAKVNGNDVATGVVTSDNANDQLNVITVVSGTSLSYIATGAYSITVTVVGAGSPTGRVDGAVIGYLSATVADTSAAKYAIVSSSVTKTVTLDTVGEAVQAAFDFSINGTTLDPVDPNYTYSYVVSNGLAVPTADNGTGTITAGTTLYIDSVVITDSTGALDRTYTVSVKKTIAVR